MTEEYGQGYEQTQGGKGEGYPSPFASSQHAGVPSRSIPGDDLIADRVSDFEGEDGSHGFPTDADEDDVFVDKGVTSIPRLSATRGGGRACEARGRRRPEAEHQPRAAAADPGHLAAQRAAGRRLRPAGRRVQAHPLRLEEAVRGAGAGRPDGPAARCQGGSRLPELTKRTILMLKEANPDWGCQRISDMLRGGRPCRPAPRPWRRVLHEAGYQLEEVPTRPHPDKVRHFERAKPNQLWQTDLFTFMLKRQNRRVYLVAFMDDHSRFIVGYGLHASQSAALVLEVLRAAITSLRHARGDPDRQRQPVRHLAGQERVQQGVGKARHPAGGGVAAAPADAGQDRAVLGDAVAGVPGDRGVPRPGGRPAADRSVHRPLQLPAAAPGHRRAGAGGSVLRCGPRGAADAAGAGGGQRVGVGASRVPKPPFYVTGQVARPAV